MAHDKQAINGSGESGLIEAIETTMLTSRDGTGIFVRAWVPAKPQHVLVCVQGLGGHGGYYEELARQLAFEGAITVAPDLRGHGHSRGARGDIDRFDGYLEDVDTAVTWARTSWPGKPIFVLGESMGASIAIQYIASVKHRHHIGLALIAGLVLVSPVLRPAIRPAIREVIHYVRSLLTAPSHPLIAVTGREELGCRDPVFNARLRADPLFVRFVSARFLTKLTMWLWQSIGKAHQVDLPLLVFQGGRDYIARRSGTEAFLRHVPAREQQVITFPQAYHCLFYDPDTPTVVKALATWLEAHSGT